MAIRAAFVGKHTLWIYVVFCLVLISPDEATPEAQLLLDFRGDIIDDQNVLANWRIAESGPCNWTGILCSTDGYVTGIDLAAMRLAAPALRLRPVCQIRTLTAVRLQENMFSGPLPADLASCAAVRHLNLGANNFSGRIPDDALAALQNLAYLNLSLNFFSGALPGAVGKLPQLQVLDLVGSGIRGALPEELGQLGKLQRLLLSWNDFGALPPSLRALKALQLLECAGCNLHGQIPEWLGQLHNLEYLDLSNNLLNGSIPISLMALEKLKWLELYKNKITGQIPFEITNLTSLTDLDLSDNNMVGIIPEGIARLENLAVLHLQNNSLEGCIPDAVSGMTKLYDVKLYMNKLNGSVPFAMGRNSSLLQFDVSDNNLHGAIPPTLCAQGVLWRLILFNNTFSGEFPDTYGSCTSLIRLRISGNELSGAVPAALWGLPNLTIFELHNNEFSGPIPPTIANATNLSTLKLHNNRFSGPLPPEIGYLPKLERFYASENNFSGQIPPELGHLGASLASLYLDANSLSGEVPVQIGNLLNLVSLGLSFNRLNGTIPPQIGSLEKLIFLDLSHNLLSGDLGSEIQSFDINQFVAFNCSYNKFSGKFSLGLKPEWIIGNPGVDEIHPSKFVMKKWVFIPFVVVVGGVVLMSFLLVVWWMEKTSEVVNDGGSERKWRAPWRITTFHQVSVTYKELMECLDEDCVIGRGGGGEVFKAALRSGQEVAIKKLWEGGEGMDLHDHGFKAEVDSLGAIRHRNIVKLLCCCSTITTNLLVYEYMPNGSLGDLLHCGKDNILSNWNIRCKIAIGAAQGLAYLHHDCQPQILHRDIKSNNILLNNEYEAHIADFGLAKSLNDVSMSVVAGSYGYIAPEYAYTLNINEKSDVYSFGVVLLELVTGRQPIAAEFGDAMTIVTWAKKQVRQYGEDILVELLDKSILNRCSHQCQMVSVFRIADSCTQHSPNERPSMRKVTEMLLDLRKPIISKFCDI